MPVSPEFVAKLTVETQRVYGEAELSIAGAISDAMEKGIHSPNWALDKLNSISSVQATLQRLVMIFNNRGIAAATNALVRAMVQGTDGALADLRRAQIVSNDESVNIRALMSLARSRAISDVPPWQSILRAAVDSYRSIVGQVTVGVLSGVDTRRQASQKAIWSALDQGITNMVDSRGRTWQLATWAEMSVRTSTARAHVDAHVEKLRDYGQNLVIISDAPQECKICRPFEGQVLTIDGTPDKRAQGSLIEARGAGLFHPNCRHTADLYIPGVTRRPTHTADPKGNADRQRLRALERQVRAWKLKSATAMTPEGKKEADAKVRAYQAAIRAHVQTTTAKRQPQRERLSAR